MKKKTGNLNEFRGIKEFLDTGAVVLIGIFLLLAGFLMWNSNEISPPKEIDPPGITEQYKIITDNGECWVVEYDAKGVKESLMKGDDLIQCKMYLRHYLKLGKQK